MIVQLIKYSIVAKYLNGISRPGLTRSFHAHVLMIVLWREFRTIERGGPGKAEALENRIASSSHLLAQTSARSDWRGYLFGTHRRVHRAQEQVQLRTAMGCKA